MRNQSSVQEPLTEFEKTIKNIHLNNDRVLIQFKTQPSDVRKGLYIPYETPNSSTMKQGYVMKVGPGYPTPSFEVEGMKESYMESKDSKVNYIPLQFVPGDQVIFDSKLAVEVLIEGAHFFIIKDQDIEMFLRFKD